MLPHSCAHLLAIDPIWDNGPLETSHWGCEGRLQSVWISAWWFHSCFHVLLICDFFLCVSVEMLYLFIALTLCFYYFVQHCWKTHCAINLVIYSGECMTTFKQCTHKYRIYFIIWNLVKNISEPSPLPRKLCLLWLPSWTLLCQFL